MMNLFKNVMASVLLFFAALTAQPERSLAGGVNGGGGRAVVCRNTDGSIRSARMLDLYEAELIFGLQLLSDQGTFEEQSLGALIRLQKHVQYGVEGIDTEARWYDWVSWKQPQWESRLRDFTHAIRFVENDTVLTPTPDSFEAAVPRGCAIEQVANFYDNKVLLVSREIWDKFPARDRAALLSHEVYYLFLRQSYGEENSIRARQIVGRLFSTDQLLPILATLAERDRSRPLLVCTGVGEQGHVAFFAQPYIYGREGVLVTFIALGKRIILSNTTAFFPGLDIRHLIDLVSSDMFQWSGIREGHRASSSWEGPGRVPFAQLGVFRETASSPVSINMIWGELAQTPYPLVPIHCELAQGDPFWRHAPDVLP